MILVRCFYLLGQEGKAGSLFKPCSDRFWREVLRRTTTNYFSSIRFGMSCLYFSWSTSYTSVACLPKSDMIFARKKVYCAMVFVVLAIKA